MPANVHEITARWLILLMVAIGSAGVDSLFGQSESMPWIGVAADARHFRQLPANEPFIPWGFNYDHDERQRLLEDYWVEEWPKVESDFAEMKELGANVVRVHLQFGRFMDSPDRANEQSLRQLSRLVALAERLQLYLDVTGLGCYHKPDVPAWYDQLDERGRWRAQGQFWRVVAERCASSPAIFCYDLMNEPVVPAGQRADGNWLGPPFGDKYFVQFITLQQQDRPRPDIASSWIAQLTAAIRDVDRRHLITVGLVDWSLDRKGLTSGFSPPVIADHVDFLSVHLYPQSGQLRRDQETLRAFSVGKPVVVEETFPLKCSPAELADFIRMNRAHAAGWISFYWGKSREDLEPAKTITDALLGQWLDVFTALHSP